MPNEKKTKLLAKFYKESLFWTCKHLLKYEHVNEYTHGQVIKELESKTKRKLIVMPRGSLKSSVGVVGYSIWSLMKNCNERILIDSELYTNSKNFMREIRAHFASEDFIRTFGDWKSRQWSEGELTIATRTKKFKEASITCSGIETIKVGQHYTIIICDDLNSQNNSQTVEGRKKVIDHYRHLISLLEPDGVLVVIGTRYAEDDVIGYILKNEAIEEWKTIQPTLRNV